MILANLLYILQLENYDHRRFLLFAYQNLNWFVLSRRGTITWTIRTRVLLLITLFFVICILTIGWKASPVFLIVALIGCIVFLPILVVVADMILSPFVIAAKEKRIGEAQKIIHAAKEKKLITIGITGSFGKTTMKNTLHAVLSPKYSVFLFPGNINTDIGVANYIRTHVEEIMSAEILICEMGAYHVGDIAALCRIIQPDYSITTAIGTAHIDRFGSVDNLATAKCELANATGTIAFLNGCNDSLMRYAKEKISHSVTTRDVCGTRLTSHVTPLPNFSGISFDYNGEIYTTQLLADYIVDLAVIAFSVADELNVPKEDYKKGFEKMKPTPHRLEPIFNAQTKRTIIDDSYNGNESGFMAGLDVLQRATGRKIVLTPGIVELGAELSREVHERVAKKYIESVDLVLLVDNAETKHIVEVFDDEGYTTYKVYESAAAAHEDLANVLEAGDTILFQNDATDNYR